MWLFTKFGFFSVVQKPGESELTIRARVRHDLISLKRQYLPEMGEISSYNKSDYPFRAKVSHQDYALALHKIAMDIDYSNFKDEVHNRLGSDRAKVYTSVWATLIRLEDGSQQNWFDRMYSLPSPTVKRRKKKKDANVDPVDPMVIARNTLTCPECGDILYWAEKGRFYYCRNKQCDFTLDEDAKYAR